MTELSSLDFTPPPEHVVIDVDALLAAVPRATVNKRIFVDFALRLAAPRMRASDVLVRARVDLSRYHQPFDDIPWHDYFRVMVVTAELLRGPEHLSMGLREIGRSLYVSLLETPIGPMLLGRRLGEAVRKAADVWQEFNSIGQVRSELLGEREFDYHFEDYPDVLVDSVGVGVFEGLFRHHHMPVDIGIARPQPRCSIVRLRW